MKDQCRHIVQCFQEHLGEDNVALVWKSSNMSDRCGIDIFYSVLQDGRELSSNGTVTPSLEMSVEATAKTGKITEMYYGGPEYRARIYKDDTIIYGSINEVEPSCPLLYSPPALPSHQIWLESILAAGGVHINDFTKQFIPESRLPE